MNDTEKAQACADAFKPLAEAATKIRPRKIKASDWKRALALLDEANGCILDELNSMDEEEQSQPMVRGHVITSNKIERFLKRVR